MLGKFCVVNQGLALKIQMIANLLSLPTKYLATARMSSMLLCVVAACAVDMVSAATTPDCCAAGPLGLSSSILGPYESYRRSLIKDQQQCNGLGAI